MSNKNEPDIFEQMSIFQIMNLLDDPENTFSSEDISKIIDKLSGVKRKKESIEAKKRQQEERERREREAREAKERKEAHIREVTSIGIQSIKWTSKITQTGDFQLDWETTRDYENGDGEDYKKIIGALNEEVNPPWGKIARIVV